MKEKLHQFTQNFDIYFVHEFFYCVWFETCFMFDNLCTLPRSFHLKPFFFNQYSNLNRKQGGIEYEKRNFPQTRSRGFFFNHIYIYSGQLFPRMEFYLNLYWKKNLNFPKKLVKKKICPKIMVKHVRPNWEAESQRENLTHGLVTNTCSILANWALNGNYVKLVILLLQPIHCTHHLSIVLGMWEGGGTRGGGAGKQGIRVPLMPNL